MYAVIESGGKQYLVEPGKRLRVERLPLAPGATVTLRPLLVKGEEGPPQVGGDLAGTTVKAKVVCHQRGPKLKVTKFKPKTGYRRRQGHRQELTQLEIVEISGGEGD